MSIAEQLAAPFSTGDIKWRVGFRSERGDRGSALAYVEARTVMQRLDEVLGFDGWASEITPVSGSDGTLLGAKCRITLFLESGEVWREDFGSASNEEALKGAASDALKRAAVQFGVGRYLYEMPSTWVNLDANGRLAEIPELPDWAIPENERVETPPPPAAQPARNSGRRPRATWRE